MKIKPKKIKNTTTKTAAEPREEFMGGKLRYKPTHIPSKDLRTKSEVKNMILMIDRELNNNNSLPELDFKAGYIAGKIYEKALAGLITPYYQEKLTNILHTKYEIMRTLEGEKECYLQ